MQAFAAVSGRLLYGPVALNSRFVIDAAPNGLRRKRMLSNSGGLHLPKVWLPTVAFSARSNVALLSPEQS